VLGIVWWATRSNTTSSSRGRAFGQGGPIPVGVAQVAAGDVRVTVDGLGTVTPLATVTVHPQVTGYLNRFDITEGQMVKAGQLLAEIDPRPFQAALAQAKGQLAKDEATLTKDKIDLGRYQGLWKENAISQQILQDQVGTVGTDQGVVASDRATVETARINLEFCRITSPVAGRVGLRQVDPGNLVVSGGGTAIIVVTELQPISVLFSLPEDSINEVMRRANAGEKLSTTVYDRSMTTKLADGSLSNVDNEIDPTTGMVKIRAMFDNQSLSLFPSQFVNIRLLLTTLHNQTYVPSAAIQHGAEGTYVYVIDKSQPSSPVSNMRTVKTGPTDGDKIAITGGLKPGDIVVVDGADRLSDGKQVLLPGMKAPTPTTSATASPAPDSTTQHGKWNGQHHSGHHRRHGGAQSSGQGGSQ
jgi:membrane fusion protein, multidrug efflux system